MPPTRHQQHSQKWATASTSSSQNPPENLANDKPATSGGLRELTDKEELFAKNAVSVSYKSYGTPKLSKQKDKSGQCMIAYPCTMCGTKINRPTSDLSCSNLIKHASASKAKHKRTVLWLDLGLPVRGQLSQKRFRNCARYGAPKLLVLFPHSLKLVIKRSCIQLFSSIYRLKK
ncbi:hypothetical protein PCASD_25477, partial [Puccinia coronata f. sp. avenae]